jgi:hypothetical protein
MIVVGWNPEGHPPFAREASATWARRHQPGLFLVGTSRASAS